MVGTNSIKNQVCAGCIRDRYLKTRVRKEGKQRRCHFCRKLQPCFEISEIASLVEEVLQENFELSEEWDQDAGETLLTIVTDLLDVEEPIADAVIADLTVTSYREVKQGGRPRWDSDSNYLEKHCYADEHNQEWDELKNDVSYRSRFFNERAAAIFKDLMDGLRDLRVVGMEGDAGIRLIEPAGSVTFYRARRADDPHQLQKITKSRMIGVEPEYSLILNSLMLLLG